jgi:flagellar biosynthesis activator protein FlaF
VSIQAYQRTAQLGETPRSAEYRAFAQITRDLIWARDNGPIPDFAAWMNALVKNRELWEILAVDCAGEGNALPAPVRAQIVSLALFVDRHTSAVCVDNAPIDPLIDINKTMMEALAPSAPATAR